MLLVWFYRLNPFRLVPLKILKSNALLHISRKRNTIMKCINDSLQSSIDDFPRGFVQCVLIVEALSLHSAIVYSRTFFFSLCDIESGAFRRPILWRWLLLLLQCGLGHQGVKWYKLNLTYPTWKYPTWTGKTNDKRRTVWRTADQKVSRWYLWLNWQ